MGGATSTNEYQVTDGGSSAATGGFELSDADFDRIRAVIREITGISMGDSKRQLVYRRLSGRLKALNMTSVRSYMAFLETGDASEVELFTNAVTTNLTSFFREHHHFEYLQRTIIPEIVQAKGNGSRRLRFWSAGCSTGEEPYSIAITLRETLRNVSEWDARLLCTDLDSDVIAKASAGIYPENRVEKIPEKSLKRWFQHSSNDDGKFVRARDELRNLIAFKQLNLMHDWPMRGKFDVIFCRNVVIYFDKPTQRVLMDRFANILEDGGYLILGHSESLFNVSDRFSLIGKTIYRKSS